MPNPPAGTTQHRLVTIGRWLLVIPAAYFAHWITDGALTRLLCVVGTDLRSSAYPAFVFPLLQTLPAGMALTGVGGIVAPDRRLATASVLAVANLLLAWSAHVVVQTNLGINNYMHATGESLGALIGVVVVVRYCSRQSAAHTIQLEGPAS